MACRERKSKQLTEENIDALCRLVRQGDFLCVAAGKVGIHRTTVDRWVNEEVDEKSQSLRSRLLRYFQSEYARARSENCSKLEADMQATGVEDWKMYAWLLEKKFPKLYNSVTKIDADVKHSGELSFAASVLKDMADNFTTKPIKEDDEDE